MAADALAPTGAPYARGRDHFHFVERSNTRYGRVRGSVRYSQLGELASCSLDLPECPGLDHPPEVEHSLAERVERFLAHHRVAADARLAAAGGHLGHCLAGEGL